MKNETIITQKHLAKTIEGKLPEINAEQIDFIIDEIKEAIVDNLKKGFGVRLLGFGTFEPFTRHERLGVNPYTKESITMPEVTIPKFRASTKFKKSLKNK